MLFKCCNICLCSCKCYVLFKCVIYVCVHVSVMCYLSVCVIYVCVHVSVMCYLSV